MSVARSRTLAIAVFAAASSLAWAPNAVGAAPTLTGEVFLDFADLSTVGPSPSVLQGTCDRDGTTRFTITSEGAATGPYNGTYTETASVEIGPQTGTPIIDGGPFQTSYGLTVGPVVRYDATFRIEALDANDAPVTVTGRKYMSGRAPVPAPQFGTHPGNYGFCADFDGSPAPPVYSPNTPAITGFVRGVDASSLEYVASIHSAAGFSRDQGASRANVRNTYVEFTGFPGSNGGRVDQFVEGFLSDYSEAQTLTMQDCKKESWQFFEVFRNQGDCVSFLATMGRNEPAGP
jgi:hypothetical protein